MNIVVQSRFACLKNEDEEVSTKTKTTKTAPKDNAKNKNLKEKDKKSATTNTKQGNKKQKAAKVATAKQWEDWKQKDEKLLNGNFEQDLENAMILSKIHFEENKDKINPDGKGKKAEKKKGAKKTVTLDQFLAGEKEPEVTNLDNVEINEKESKENFFAKMSEDAKTALTKEKLKDEFRERQNVMDTVITSSQYQEKLQVELDKNEELRKELEKSQKEIASVKGRNKTLYTLLSTGEMKGKAEIITELEKLTVIKDELTQEVTRLHGLLEQERSKVAALTNDKQLHKKSGKKH